MKTAAMFIPEVDIIRVDLPVEHHTVTVLLQPDEAIRLATALKVALAQRTRKAKP